jgi:hypothetical protein
MFSCSGQFVRRIFAGLPLESWLKLLPRLRLFVKRCPFLLKRRSSSPRTVAALGGPLSCVHACKDSSCPSHG